MNSFELVTLVREIHEDAVLAPVTYLDEYHMTPFDAFHASLVATKGEQVLSTKLDNDTVGLDRYRLLHRTWITDSTVGSRSTDC